MAKWTKKKVTPEEINNGNEYNVNDNLSVESINSIINNSFKAQEDSEEALKKANSAYEANGTLVKINGVNQITWDATISQKFSEESANLFDGVYDLAKKYINPSTGQYATASDLKASSKLYSLNNAKKIYFKISEAFRSMVLLFYDENGNYLNEYVSLNKLSSYVYTIQGNASYFRTYTAEENNANIMISSIDLPYQPYNQKRQITNPQAEFLKEKFNDSANEFKVPFGVFKYNTADYHLVIDGNSVAIKDAGGNSSYVIIDTKFTFEEFSLSAKFSNNYERYIYAPFDENNNLITDLVVEGMQYLKAYNGYFKDADSISVKKDSRVAYFRIGFVATSGGGVTTFSDIMLNKGLTPMPPQDYNQKEHITNEEAGLLKNKYDRSINLFDKNKFVSFGNYIGFDISNLQIGETYTFSTNLPIAWFKISTESGGYSSVESVGVKYKYTFKMAKHSNILSSKKQYLFLGINQDSIYEVVSNISQLNNYEIQIEKGSVETNHQTYDSRGHVTKNEIDLLKDEYILSANQLNESKHLSRYCSYSNGKWTTPTPNGYNFSFFTNQAGYTADRDVSKLPYLKKGAYTIIIYDVSNITMNDLDVSIANYNSSGVHIGVVADANLNNLINNCLIIPFAIGQDSYVDIRLEGNAGSISFSAISYYKGIFTKVVPHHDWNGKIVHEEDITPLLIWENASPNSDFGELNLNNANLLNYKYLTILYSQVWLGCGLAVAKFRLHKGTAFTLDVVNNGTGNNNNYARDFTVGGTSLTIGNAYDKDKNIDNRRLIPVEIYLSNY